MISISQLASMVTLKPALTSRMQHLRAHLWGWQSGDGREPIVVHIAKLVCNREVSGLTVQRHAVSFLDPAVVAYADIQKDCSSSPSIQSRHSWMASTTL